MVENTREIRTIIDGLREEIRRIERRPPQRVCFISSGRPEIDALLPGGGFPRGALSEIAGGPASGKTGLAMSALAVAMGREGLAAFVDGRGELYPPAVMAFGVDLARLLVVRPSAPDRGAGASVRHAFWAAEALLASGAFEAVAVDIPIERARVRAPIEGARAAAPIEGARAAALDASSLDRMFFRLRAAAERGGGAALWLGLPQGIRVPSAAARLELSAGAAGSEVRRTFARGAGDLPRTAWHRMSPCPVPSPSACHAA